MREIRDFTREERAELLDDIVRAFEARGEIDVRFVRVGSWYRAVIDDESAGRSGDDAVVIGTVRKDGSKWVGQYHSRIGIVTATVEGRRIDAGDSLAWVIAHEHGHRTHFLAAGRETS